MKTYISLFSSAGVGCYGFKMAGYECVATNELIERRLEIQKFNNKCKYPSGYICGDITKLSTQKLLFSELKMWEKKENLKQLDVLIATPPCQGMSVANHKKTDHEIIRNSLVVESIKIINTIKPKFFIFENVPAFMKTVCTDIDGIDKPISEAIKHNLGDSYLYFSKVINFKNYGACSSRLRTLVIGVNKELTDFVSPFELFPNFSEEKTLRQTIGDLKPLKIMGEIDPKDIYHFFRPYPEYMRNWIKDLKEGQSAFDNKDIEKRPHQIINGELVQNKRKNADKYTRQFWDKVGPCVHTRNDQLASQNTIHPSDDRVFSIRELMRMMTVPNSFKWSKYGDNELNQLNIEDKKKYLKKEEIKIRQSLGEAVPTNIFYEIALNIKNYGLYNFKEEQKEINKIKFSSQDSLIQFIKNNPLKLSPYALMSIAELNNTKRTDNSAYYTNKSLMAEMLLRTSLPEKEKQVINVLEPSVGIGSFIFLLVKRYENLNLNIDTLDIDKNSLELFKLFLKTRKFPKNIKITTINDDFLLHKFKKKYDLIIGNPPFNKLKKSSKLIQYKKEAINKETNNIASYFLDKSFSLSSNIALVFPKFLLNTPEFKQTRDYLSKNRINFILDFGEQGFKGVLIETIAISITPNEKPGKTLIYSFTKDVESYVLQSYITDNKYPYWLIYRNEKFDKIANKLDFDVFTVFRDRQITNKFLKKEGDIWVVKSRNISNDEKLIHIPGYDSYINMSDAINLAVYKFYKDNNIYLAPNLTYYPRVLKKRDEFIVNGSVAILQPKKEVKITQGQLKYFCSDEYRYFYQIARNYQTRSLNIDKCSVFFFGLLKED